MAYYSLETKDYRHPKEIPAFIITAAVMFIAFAYFTYLVFFGGQSDLLYFYIFFVGGYALIFVVLYLLALMRLASFVEVGPSQFPDVYHAAADAARRLDMPLPRIYVKFDPHLNAFANGFKHNFFIVLYTALIDALDETELRALIGHEMAHCKGNHAVIRGILFTSIDNPVFNLIKVFLWPLQVMMMFIFRYQEYSCDRAGLIASGSIYHSVTLHLKLTLGREMFERVNISEFFKQIEEFRSNKVGILAELESTHPFTVNRIRAVVQFYKSPEYQAILEKLGEDPSMLMQDQGQDTMLLLNNVVKQHRPQNPYPAAAAANILPQEGHQPAAVGQPVLRGLTGHYAGVEFPLGIEKVAMGRDAQLCQIVFPSDFKQVSRLHCTVQYIPHQNHFVVEDRSTSGTFRAGGEKLEKGSSSAIKPGELFYLADRNNQFELSV